MQSKRVPVATDSQSTQRPQDGASVLALMLDPVSRCFDTESARSFVNLRIDPAVQERVDVLAEKANEGLLAEAERAEYSVRQYRRLHRDSQAQGKTVSACQRQRADGLERRASLSAREPVTAVNTASFARSSPGSLTTLSTSSRSSIAALSDPSNLALACNRCNACEGPNLSGVDSETSATVSLFHPKKRRLGRALRVPRCPHCRTNASGKSHRCRSSDER